MDRDSEREVSYEQGEKFRREKGIEFFIETSAKTNQNVQETFVVAAKMLYKKHQEKIQQAKASLMAKVKGKKLKKTDKSPAKNSSCSC